MFVESTAEENDIKVGECFYSHIRSRDEAFCGFGGGEEEFTDGRFFERGNGSSDVVLPHHFFCCFPTCCKWTSVGAREDISLVEVNVALAAGVRGTRVYAERLEGLFE